MPWVFIDSVKRTAWRAWKFKPTDKCCGERQGNN